MAGWPSAGIRSIASVPRCGCFACNGPKPLQRAAPAVARTAAAWPAAHLVHRTNAEGVAGLSSRKAAGRKPVLDAARMAAFRQIVETGPGLAIDKVVRWRCVDLKRVLEERFGVAGRRAPRSAAAGRRS